ncbi:MAG: T9SS type A sorting domain-containing protein, partial [Mameliella sp.]|nr:T9SS type A sorting domain-containing protein [Phaeodactylibacter sp.]
FTPGSLSEIDFTPAGSFETGQEDPTLVISQIIDEAHAIVSVVRTNQEGVNLQGYIGNLWIAHPAITISDWLVLQADGDVFELPGEVLPQWTTSTQDIAEQFTLNAYPVPAQKQVHIETNEQVYAQIFNSSGQLVWSEILQPGINDVDVEAWQAGLYILQAKGRENVVNTRLIVNR